MRFGRVALSTLVAHRRRNGRNPDLAVTVVEVCVFASGVLLLLRCLGHFHSPELQSFLAFVPSHKMAHEWGGITRQIVWSRDICGRPAAPRIIGAAMVNPALSCCGQSRFVCSTALVHCDIPATGPQEGDQEPARNVATARFFRLIAA